MSKRTKYLKDFFDYPAKPHAGSRWHLLQGEISSKESEAQGSDPDQAWVWVAQSTGEFAVLGENELWAEQTRQRMATFVRTPFAVTGRVPYGAVEPGVAAPGPRPKSAIASANDIRLALRVAQTAAEKVFGAPAFREIKAEYERDADMMASHRIRVRVQLPSDFQPEMVAQQRSEFYTLIGAGLPQDAAPKLRVLLDLLTPDE